MCIDLHSILASTSHLDMLFEMKELENRIEWNDQGKFGAEFFVSTKELEYSMHHEQYVNKFIISQAKSIMSEFNLSLSMMMTDIAIL